MNLLSKDIKRIEKAHRMGEDTCNIYIRQWALTYNIYKTPINRNKRDKRIEWARDLNSDFTKSISTRPVNTKRG